MKDSKFYVCIKEPAELKDNILQSSKGILRSLKNFEEFKGIRQKKEAYIARLSENIEQIKIMSKQLDEMLPEYSEEEVPAMKKKGRKVRMDVKELNKEIEEVEKKISDLGL